MLKNFISFSVLVGCTLMSLKCHSQKIVEAYAPLKKDSLRIGVTESDFLPFIQEGYTAMLPEDSSIRGTLVFLEDSGYDKRNKNAKQLYKIAAEKGLAVLSVSTELPFDFYFSNTSMSTALKLIQNAFIAHHLPNKNIFFIGVGLAGHRAMRIVRHMKLHKHMPQFNIQGLVICNSMLDWIRKWQQYDREIRLKRNNLWEPRFVNYMLETHLGGTPDTSPKQYRDFSTYSYFGGTNENAKMYKEYAVRAYIEPAIKHWLETRLKTLYENNSPDLVGLLAELELAGNTNTELIVLRPKDNPSPTKNPDTTWQAMDKTELMDWILEQIQE